MGDMLTVKSILKEMNFQPIEKEGGCFAPAYQSTKKTGEKPIASSGYILWSNGAFSHLHRLPSDEIYHFYSGDPVELLEITENGQVILHLLGLDLENNQRPQVTINANSWHGGRVMNDGGYALMGVTMSPGFCDGDYEHCNHPEKLIQDYPQWEHMIRALTGPVTYY